MQNQTLATAWIKTGYALFAAEGLEGVRIERIAKELKLNKSGFYHYFGDRESFLEELAKHHIDLAHQLAGAFQNIKQIDPDLINLMVATREPILAHMQMMRNNHHPVLNACYLQANDMTIAELLPRFAEYIGITQDLEFAGKYLEYVRDMVHVRLTPENLNETFLRNLFSEIKLLMQSRGSLKGG